MPKAALVTDLIVNEENRYGAIAPNKKQLKYFSEGLYHWATASIKLRPNGTVPQKSIEDAFL